MTRPLVWLATVLSVVAAALLVPVVGAEPSNTARAAGLMPPGFDPGNIISDAVFYDSLAMNQGEIQRFLEVKGASCQATASTPPCLKDYVVATASMAADQYCAGFSEARQDTAASIIAKVAASCGVSPRVLLVLLEKEQTLVTRSTPKASAYTNATGFGCPDTAPCNAQFSGFVSQVYFAARAFKVYQATAATRQYRAGRYNAILWNPNQTCGSSQVFIANQATAGLYIYTPYQPNQAALDAYPGEGDACSSYGNRNFYAIFTKWFVSTQSPGASAILDAYDALGGATGRLGAVTSGYICGLTAGGCFQNFQNGAIYWTQATGAHAVGGAIGGSWAARGWEKSPLGYPTGDEICGLTRGGCLQTFQNATLYYSPATGAQPVQQPIIEGYHAQGWELGPAGYPVGGQICGLVGGGCFQVYEGAVIYSSTASGAHAVRGAIFGTWAALGWERSWLGYPTGEDTCGTSSTGCSQTFQNGTVYWSPATGAVPVKGAIGAAWSSGTGAMPLVGYPAQGEICGLVNGGCFQVFASGSVYFSPATGAHAVRGAIAGTWGALGWERGPLGYPTADDTCGTSSTGCSQTFQNGTVYWSPATGAHSLRGDFATAWTSIGGAGSSLGYPTGEQICGLLRGGCFQTFANGSLYSSPATGTHAVTGAILQAWGARGWETGSLGYPVDEAHAVAGGVAQPFQGGTLTADTVSGTVTPS